MNNRWKTAIHEAAHAAAAIALGGTVTRASLGDDGSGLCYCEVDTNTDQAFLTAAGPIAEELLADTPSPADEFETVQPATPRILPLILSETDRQFIAAKDASRGKDSLSDDRFLALWAINGCENQPERWAERVAFANHIARQIVGDHRDEIIRIATALFFRQTIFQAEIEAAFHHSAT